LVVGACNRDDVTTVLEIVKVGVITQAETVACRLNNNSAE
jgi:hypothetical protein